MRFLVPVTGAGPDCSLLGNNALERGCGIMPHAAHFGAVTWLEAVLPDGSVYQGSLSALGGHEGSLIVLSLFRGSAEGGRLCISPPGFAQRYCVTTSRSGGPFQNISHQLYERYENGPQ